MCILLLVIQVSLALRVSLPVSQKRTIFLLQREVYSSANSNSNEDNEKMSPPVSRAPTMSRGVLFSQVKRTRKVSELWSLVEELGTLRDEREYTIVISAWGRVRKPDMAIALLSQMENEGLRPNVITYNAVISACEKGRQWGRACALLEEMPSKGLIPNVVTYSAAISACEKGSQWQKALSILQNMQSNGVQPNVVTYSAAISACGKGGQWQKAVQLLDTMRMHGVQPNVVSYNAAMSACEKVGHWQTVLNLLDQLKCDTSLEPSLISYNTAIAACAKHGQLARTQELLNDMEIAGIQPDLATYRTLLVGCEIEAKQQHSSPFSFDDTDQIFQKNQHSSTGSTIDPMAMLKHIIADMRERQLSDITSFKLAIAACEHAGHWETALDLARQRDAALTKHKSSFQHRHDDTYRSGKNSEGLTS
mmetsp:Transcript_5263/g.7411  ORF Transcript_5263/g.7411 Transcript_5263/m.7411 type:complete len:421 (+) Transcript_5263:156-1418(+)